MAAERDIGARFFSEDCDESGHFSADEGQGSGWNNSGGYLPEEIIETCDLATFPQPTPLPAKILEHIEEKRSRARKRRAEVLEAAAAAATGAVGEPLTELTGHPSSSAQATVVVHKLPRRTFQKDSGAGFFYPDEETQQSATGVPKQAAMDKLYDFDDHELPEEYPAHPICLDCGCEFDGSLLQKQFGLRVCNECRQRLYHEKYALITKTEAKQEYLLNEWDLQDGEDSLRYVLKKNTKNERWSSMKLYLRCQVEARAYALFGNEQGLDEEVRRRAVARQRARHKQHDKQMKTMRRETLTSSWLKAPTGAHQHQFDLKQEQYDEGSDEYIKTCVQCNVQIRYEKM